MDKLRNGIAQAESESQDRAGWLHTHLGRGGSLLLVDVRDMCGWGWWRGLQPARPKGQRTWTSLGAISDTCRGWVETRSAQLDSEPAGRDATGHDVQADAHGDGSVHRLRWSGLSVCACALRAWGPGQSP